MNCLIIPSEWLVNDSWEKGGGQKGDYLPRYFFVHIYHLGMYLSNDTHRSDSSSISLRQREDMYNMYQYYTARLSPTLPLQRERSRTVFTAHLFEFMFNMVKHLLYRDVFFALNGPLANQHFFDTLTSLRRGRGYKTR